jgi:hypothetical protein
MSCDDALSPIHSPLRWRHPGGLRLTPDAEEDVPPREYRLLADITADTPVADAPQAWARLRLTRCPDQRLRCEQIRGLSPLVVRRCVVEDLDAARAFFGDGDLSRELFRRVALGIGPTRQDWDEDDL